MNIYPQKERKPFFEGWYFKHESENNSIAFIVGRNIESNNAGSAFIQVMTKDESFNINYPLDSFRLFKNKFIIKVGNSYFSEKGIFVDIDTYKLRIKGKFHYSSLTPLKNHIMGIFRYIPYLECSHNVISMEHKVFGKLNINSQTIIIDKAKGYIEADSGHSFPKSYTWFQCNTFDNINASVMLAVAEIPFLSRSFQGIICAIIHKGKEYRLATYLGAEADFCNDYCIIIKQNKYKLVVRLSDSKGHKLFAPSKGCMSKVIYESLCAKGKVWFYNNDELVFFGNSFNCSYEIVK